MRRDIHYLEDIRIAREEIASFIVGMNLSKFHDDPKTQSAVERQLITMGEAASRLSADFKAQAKDVPWRRLIQLRNFYVHGYDRLEPNEVWSTATKFVPRVVRLVTPLILAEEDGE